MASFCLTAAYRTIDRVLHLIAWIGAFTMIGLMLIVVYDVLTRYFGFGKVPGVNSTMMQESQYWAHTVIFSLVIGFGYVRQVHVRIDLVTSSLARRTRLLLELTGCLLFLMPFSLVGAFYCFGYARQSYVNGEISASTIGLSNLWILKSMLVVMFILLFLAGLSQVLKCVEGLRGTLPATQVDKLVGGGH
ncbi:TRAP transporter small permease subunit [Nitratireductor sp. GISD-1A_MAKvit]|uniref:TRAP transporter small permease subunit n=1 Tax=Nitratireductor sp. GISD-1A_MAKvit TaxID=3234198 RepID=UPI00346638C6